MTIGAVKISLLALTLALWIASAATAQDRKAAAAGDPDRAQAAFQAGRYTEALALARRGADAAPTSARALAVRAGVAEFMGEFDEARSAYDRASALAPDDVELIQRTASFAVRVGDYDRAVAQLDRLLALQSTRVRGLFQWAPASMQPGLLRDHPELEHIVQIKLDVLVEKGDLGQARQLARAHGIVKPGENYCAEAQEKSRAAAPRDEILKAYRLVALGQPEAADCIAWFGHWLSDDGYVRLGRLMLVDSARVSPSSGNKDPNARYLRVRLGGNREVGKRAEQLFVIARQRYLRDGDVDNAARLFDESIRLAPTFARPYTYRAAIAADLGDHEAGLAWLQRGLQADPESWSAHRSLGKLLSELERYPEAEMQLRKAVQLFGNDAGGRLALARVLYAQAKYDDFAREARAALASLATSKTNVPEVRDFLTKFDRWGPGAALPPAPDPRVTIGWNND